MSARGAHTAISQENSSGWLLWHAGSTEEEDVYFPAVVKAFNDLGYIDGKNIHLIAYSTVEP